MSKPMLVLTLLGLLSLAVTAVAAMPAYVGPDGCKSCHRDEYQDWQLSKHAEVMELLQPRKRRGAKMKAGLDPEKDYSNDEKCLKCHTTGYGKPGGYVSSLITPTLAGVSCEMCHGPGSEYRSIHKQKTLKFTVDEVKAAGQVYGSQDAGVCKKCHNHPDSPMTSKVDAKYGESIEEKLKKNEGNFHKYYPVEGKH